MKKLLMVVFLALVVSFGARPAFAQRVAISTNAGDWLFYGTINAEASVAVSQHFSINASGRYNPWTYAKGDRDNQSQQRQRSADLGMRYWPWHVYSGWFVGAKAQWQEFNRTGFNSRHTSEGTGYGAAISGGYSLLLTPHINMEFGLGVWGGYQKYTLYACPTCGRIIDQGSKWFFLPNEIIASVVYVF